MILGAIGDIHANTPLLHRALTALHDLTIDTVIQVGGLDITGEPDDDPRWDEIDALLNELGMTMYVAPGETDSIQVIETLTPRDDGWLPYRRRILIAPRGHRSTLGGRTFLWLGAAGRTSDPVLLDRQQFEGACRPWWPGADYTRERRDEAIDGGRVDIVVSHIAPYRLESIDPDPRWHVTINDLRVQWNRSRLAHVVARVHPHLVICGHHHRAIDDFLIAETPLRRPVRVRGLADASDPVRGVAVLDTESVKVWFVRAHRGRLG